MIPDSLEVFGHIQFVLGENLSKNTFNFVIFYLFWNWFELVNEVNCRVLS